MQHKTILLIEDDYLDIINVQRAFNKLNANHTLHIAHNGREALELLRGEGKHDQPILPDIVLLDINMPKMNGLEFLELIRQDPQLKNLKVFIITTSAEEYDKAAAERFGVTGYILKPLDFDNYSRDKGSSMDIFNLLLDIMRT